MSKFLILKTAVTSGSGVGSQSARFVVGINNILTLKRSAVNQIDIHYTSGKQLNIILTDNMSVGDESASNFISKQIQNLAASSINTFEFPSIFPSNVKSATGKNIGIGSITIT